MVGISRGGQGWAVSSFPLKREVHVWRSRAGPPSKQQVGETAQQLCLQGSQFRETPPGLQRAAAMPGITAATGSTCLWEGSMAVPERRCKCEGETHRSW